MSSPGQGPPVELRAVRSLNGDPTVPHQPPVGPEANGKTGPEQEYLLVIKDKNNALNSTYSKDVEAGMGTKEVAPQKAAEASDIPDDGRETWGKKMDFLLSIIGFAVDLANVWRFPYLCYKNGGGAFLVPYFLMLIFGAIPLFLMELTMGQFHREGAISVWKIAPIFKGIGICQCLIAYYVAFYYNVIIAWSVYFLVASFSWTLPWTLCSHEFNTPNCTTGPNITENGTFLPMPNYTVSAAAEYFERGVLGLHLSDGLTSPGPPRWQLTLCLCAVFVMLYFSLWKGVKSSGKVVWVTATMPYVVLTILLIRGVMLPGAGDGILYYITPHLGRLGDPEVWIDAATQIFYSCGAGFGVHIAYASYNKFNNNFYRDCITTALVNSFTSLFSGFVIFSYLGYMAYRQNTDIEHVATEGPGLVFVVYPEAIATLPGSVGWSIIFFIMLIMLGLDSAMGGLEAVLTGLGDEFKHWLAKRRFGREIFTGVVCGSAFIFSLQNVTNGGMYMFKMWDTFAAGTAILFGVWSLAVSIGWIYGLEQFCDDFERMVGFRPNIYWRICWKFVSPIAIFVIVVWSIAFFKPMTYESYTIGDYEYPWWANYVGWLIAFSSMGFIPGMAIYYLATAKGTFKQRLAMGISPVAEHSSISQGEKVKRYQKQHWISI